jgi:hypothetical protein
VGEVVQERGVVALELELRASVAEGMQDENQFMRFPAPGNQVSEKIPPLFRSAELTSLFALQGAQ